MDQTFRRKNHFVPEFLLKRFSAVDRNDFLWEYRLLVDDHRVPDWKLRAASRLARTSDLYTIAESRDESDHVERWLDQEFETPARGAVIAAIAGHRLEKKQWRQLVRLYAAQFVRTPAFYIRHSDRWAAEMQHALSEARDRVLLQLPTSRDIDSDSLVTNGVDGFPLRYTIRRLEGARRSLHLEFVTGRKYWMWAMKHMLRPTGIVAQLEEYNWSILTPPKNMHWFLTDNPAVCVGSGSDGVQTLDSGWGTIGSTLMLPLGPKHLLYCHVGDEMQKRSATVHPLLATQLRRYLADAALRSFYTHARDLELAFYRPRKADREQCQREADQWVTFGQEHSRAERFE